MRPAEQASIPVPSWEGLELPPPTALLEGLTVEPGLRERWLDLCNAVLTEGALRADWREIVILRVAGLRQAHYVLDAHRRIGSNAGLSDRQIACATGESGTESDPATELLAEAATQIVTEGRMAARTKAGLGELMGDHGIQEVVLIANHYLTVAGLTELLGLNNKMR